MAISDVKEAAITVGMITGGIVFLAIHPAIGILAQPILAIKAIVHAISLNYHWRHSKNEQGIALCNDYDASGNPFYMSKDVKLFKVEDLARLEQEDKRLQSRDELNETLSWMRIAAKLIIPVIGLFWALGEKTFIGSMACEGCMNGGHHEHDDDAWTDRDAIYSHIQALKEELSKRDVTDLTRA